MQAAADGIGPTHGPLLQLKALHKSFGGTQALRDVSLSLMPGEVLALLGENGAGKSTLIKILAGVHALDHGEVLFNGHNVRAAISDLPIAFIHQDLGLIEWMTVLENVCLTRGFARARGLISWRASRAATVAALAVLGVEIAPDTRIRDLGRTERSLVAIARALSTDARIVVMDEPTASLPADEAARLFAAVRRLRASGVSVIYVSHRLEEIFQIADRVVVLRDGCVVGDGAVGNLTPDALVHMIVGRDTAATTRIQGPPNAPEALAPVTMAPVALEMQQAVIGEVGPLSFSLHAGEVLALTGLRGAGQEAVGRALFGLLPLDAGAIRLAVRETLISDPSAAISQGVRYVSADRDGESVVQGFSVAENLFLNPRATGRKLLRRIRHRAERAEARRIGTFLRLSPNDPLAQIDTLSGGNKQKVVLGRWLHLRGKVLILEDPTAGVDVGAKEGIYRLLHDAVANGLAVLLIATDFVEVAAVCRRALVFSRGRIVRELVDDGLTAASVLAAASITDAA